MNDPNSTYQYNLPFDGIKNCDTGTYYNSVPYTFTYTTPVTLGGKYIELIQKEISRLNELVNPSNNMQTQFDPVTVEQITKRINILISLYLDLLSTGYAG